MRGRTAVVAARRALTGLAGRMEEGRLTVIEAGGPIRHFGRDDGGDPTDSGLTATVSVHDERAWLALAGEGSIGLGRGYIEGWWDSDDPAAVVRILIRNLAGVDELRNRLNRATGWVGDAARRALPGPTRRRDREDIGAHYDLGNDFFRLFLDRTLTYSSAVFTDPVSDLAEASLAKYDRLLSKLGVSADHELLEIGTGWGGLALRAAEERGARVTTTTVSDRQLDEARARARASPAGDRIRLLSRDWRDLTGTYDRVVSIEMIEAVDWRDYDRYFATIERCLADDGMVGLQAICVPDRRWNRAKTTEDFIRRFVFPGGVLPSIGSVVRSVARSSRLQVLDVEDFSAHYAETLRRWRRRFDERAGAVERLGLDERFRRLWRFYLAYCEAGFVERHCTVNQIVLVGPSWRPAGLELRPL
jgi:cyclopropane-fatty-acyl-phospholipid synthase